jgi:hypothetical protein
MSFNVSHIINPFLPTRNHVKNKNGDWIPETKDDGDIIILDAFNREITTEFDNIYNTDRPFVIEAFEWGTQNHENISPRLYPGESSASGIYSNLFVTIASTARGSCTARNIGVRGSSYFYKRSYDVNDNFYSFSLTNPIFMPKGGTLGWIGTGDYTNFQTVRYHIVIREM